MAPQRSLTPHRHRQEKLALHRRSPGRRTQRHPLHHHRMLPPPRPRPVHLPARRVHPAALGDQLAGQGPHARSLGEAPATRRTTRHSIDARAHSALTSTLPDQNLRTSVSMGAGSDGYAAPAEKADQGNDGQATPGDERLLEWRNIPSERPNGKPRHFSEEPPSQRKRAQSHANREDGQQCLP